MEKKTIIRFLEKKRRGSYTLLVKAYADLLLSIPITMALEVIKEDLEKESGAIVKLNYFSLARAISRSKKNGTWKSIASTPQKIEFRDSHEIQNGQSSPGSFKVGAKKAKQVQDVQ
jgi:hypothetical protein